MWAQYHCHWWFCYNGHCIPWHGQETGAAIESGLKVDCVQDCMSTWTFHTLSPGWFCMDYSDFSFPQALSEDRKLKELFGSLPEQDQLRLMRGYSSYGGFYDRVVQAIPKC